MQKKCERRKRKVQKNEAPCPTSGIKWLFSVTSTALPQAIAFSLPVMVQHADVHLTHYSGHPATLWVLWSRTFRISEITSPWLEEHGKDLHHIRTHAKTWRRDALDGPLASIYLWFAKWGWARAISASDRDVWDRCLSTRARVFFSQARCISSREAGHHGTKAIIDFVKCLFGKVFHSSIAHKPDQMRNQLSDLIPL